MSGLRQSTQRNTVFSSSTERPRSATALYLIISLPTFMAFAQISVRHRVATTIHKEHCAAPIGSIITHFATHINGIRGGVIESAVVEIILSHQCIEEHYRFFVINNSQSIRVGITCPADIGAMIIILRYENIRFHDIHSRNHHTVDRDIVYSRI